MLVLVHKELNSDFYNQTLHCWHYVAYPLLLSRHSKTRRFSDHCTQAAGICDIAAIKIQK